MNNTILSILDSATLDKEHHWTLPTQLVAEGYGVQPNTIRTHKSDHSDELLPDRHWISSNNKTLWTRAGVIRLGMFLRSPQAASFRDAAEQYLLDRLNLPVGNPDAQYPPPVGNPDSQISPALDLLAAAVADEVLARQLEDRVSYHLNQKIASRQHLETTLGKLQLPMPRDWPIVA